jgi:hypothetical protein
MPDNLLREEILDSHRAQSSLAKWKLAVVAALGAGGMGALPKSTPEMVVLWALIPPVCLYTDTLSYHAGIRVLTIARYFRLRQSTPSYQALLRMLDPADFAAVRLHDHYEWYSLRNRSQFLLEGFAVRAVSLLLCIIVMLAGAGVLVGRPALTDPWYQQPIGLCLIAFGMAGLVGTLFSSLVHQQRTAWLDHAAWADDRPRLWKLLRQRKWPEAGKYDEQLQPAATPAVAPQPSDDTAAVQAQLVILRQSLDTLTTRLPIARNEAVQAPLVPRAEEAPVAQEKLSLHPENDEAP